MLKDDVLAMCVGFTGAALVKAKREIQCTDDRKRRFFEALFREWEHEFVLQANVGIALGSIGMVKKWRFSVPEPVLVDDVPVWTNRATPYVITGFDPLYPVGSSPSFGPKGRVFKGMDTPDGKVDVFHSLWLTFRQELAFGAYMGAGRFENCYKPWWLKNFGADLYVVALQKQANRVVESRYPPGKDAKTGLSHQAVALDIGDKIRGGATVAIPSDTYTTLTLDGDEKSTGVQKWAIRFLEGAGDFRGFHEIEDHHDRKMALGYLLPPQAFMDVTGGQLGGPTSSPALAKLAKDLLMQDAADIDRHLNEYVFPAISRANFPATSPRVLVRTLNMEPDNEGILFEAVKGMLERDKPDAMYFDLRSAMERLEFPLRSDADVEKEEQQAEAAKRQEQQADAPPQEDEEEAAAEVGAIGAGGNLEGLPFGGPGSGNWGHRGRPGTRGGSGSGGGSIADRERAISGNATETMIAFDPKTGKEVFRKAGEASSVNIEDGELEAIRGAVLTHNHPDYVYKGGVYVSGSFTGSDFETAARVGAAELRVVTSTHRYIARPKAGRKFPHELNVWQTYADEHKRVYKAVMRRVKAGRMTMQEASSSLNHLISQAVCEKLSLEYVMEAL